MGKMGRKKHGQRYSDELSEIGPLGRTMAKSF